MRSERKERETKETVKIFGNLLKNAFVKYIPPTPPLSDYKALYGSEEVISDYTLPPDNKDEKKILTEEEKDNLRIISEKRIAFIEQVNKLLDAYRDWGTKNKLTDTHANIEMLRAQIFDVAYTGKQVPLYYETIKLTLERLFFVLVQETSIEEFHEKRKEEYSLLLKSVIYCGPSKPFHINQTYLNLTNPLSLTGWLAVLRMNVITDIASRYPTKYRNATGVAIPPAYTVHINSGFVRYAVKQGWNPFFEDINIDDPYIHSVGLDDDHPEQHAIAIKRLLEFEREFLARYQESIVNTVQEQFYLAYTSLFPKAKEKDGFIDGDNISAINNLLKSIGFDEDSFLSSYFFDLNEDGKIRYNATNFKIAFLNFCLKKGLYFCVTLLQITPIQLVSEDKESIFQLHCFDNQFENAWFETKDNPFIPLMDVSPANLGKLFNQLPVIDIARLLDASPKFRHINNESDWKTVFKNIENTKTRALITTKMGGILAQAVKDEILKDDINLIDLINSPLWNESFKLTILDFAMEQNAIGTVLILLQSEDAGTLNLMKNLYKHMHNLVTQDRSEMIGHVLDYVDNKHPSKHDNFFVESLNQVVEKKAEGVIENIVIPRFKHLSASNKERYLGYLISERGLELFKVLFPQSEEYTQLLKNVFQEASLRPKLYLDEIIKFVFTPASGLFSLAKARLFENLMKYNNAHLISLGIAHLHPIDIKKHFMHTIGKNQGKLLDVFLEFGIDESLVKSGITLAAHIGADSALAVFSVKGFDRQVRIAKLAFALEQDFFLPRIIAENHDIINEVFLYLIRQKSEYAMRLIDSASLTSETVTQGFFETIKLSSEASYKYLNILPEELVKDEVLCSEADKSLRKSDIVYRKYVRDFEAIRIFSSLDFKEFKLTTTLLERGLKMAVQVNSSAAVNSLLRLHTFRPQCVMEAYELAIEQQNIPLIQAFLKYKPPAAFPNMYFKLAIEHKSLDALYTLNLRDYSLNFESIQSLTRIILEAALKREARFTPSQKIENARNWEYIKRINAVLLDGLDSVKTKDKEQLQLLTALLELILSTYIIIQSESREFSFTKALVIMRWYDEIELLAAQSKLGASRFFADKLTPLLETIASVPIEHKEQKTIAPESKTEWNDAELKQHTESFSLAIEAALIDSKICSTPSEHSARNNILDKLAELESSTNYFDTLKQLVAAIGLNIAEINTRKFETKGESKEGPQFFNEHKPKSSEIIRRCESVLTELPPELLNSIKTVLRSEISAKRSPS